MPQMTIQEEWDRLDPRWVDPAKIPKDPPRLHTPERARPYLMYGIYHRQILHQVAGIRYDDLRWLCNKSGKLYKRLKDSTANNYRVCRLINGKVTQDYRYRHGDGCCGEMDVVVVNPLTGSQFSIGFNYGH